MFTTSFSDTSAWPTLPQDAIDRIEFPKLNHATVAGISVAIAGNVLISLALNCQKLAHLRIEEAREAVARAENRAHPPKDSGGQPQCHRQEDELLLLSSTDVPLSPRPSGSALASPQLKSGGITNAESEPLLRRSSAPTTTYGSGVQTVPRVKSKLSILPKFWGARAAEVAEQADRGHVRATHALMPVDVIAVRAVEGEDDLLSKPQRHEDSEQNHNESDYLRSKLWWLGFLLMNVGEIGNFISYAFAPASVVAPLGTFALIANCLFAPLMLGEYFRKLDLFGIFVAIIGAITVVLSANSTDVRLDPDGLLEAVTQRPFLIFSAVYVAAAIILSTLSEGSIGNRVVYVDVGLCAIFGGFTVLSTKALSTLLTMEWFEIFTEWITYPVVIVLLGTGVGQIRYLNRALMRFDSKIVVPTQFVLFNLSAIIGSAILYGDFRKASFHQFVTFIYGCGATFVGVFILTWTPNNTSDEDSDEDVDDDEHEDLSDETIAPRNVKLGSVARRNRATLFIPEDSRSTPASPILRHRQSLVSMIGFSPAQRVLLVHTPPRDEFIRSLADVERGANDPHRPMQIPESITRRRTVSWFGEEPSPRTRSRRMQPRSNAGSRENSQSRARPREGRSESAFS